MSNEEQMRRGVRQVVRVVTTWMESDSESADADFAIQQLKQIERDAASGDLIIGCFLAVSSLLHDLAARTGEERGTAASGSLASLSGSLSPA